MISVSANGEKLGQFASEFYNVASSDQASFDEASFDEASYDEASFDEASFDEATFDEAYITMGNWLDTLPKRYEISDDCNKTIKKNSKNTIKQNKSNVKTEQTLDNKNNKKNKKANKKINEENNVNVDKVSNKSFTQKTAKIPTANNAMGIILFSGLLIAATIVVLVLEVHKKTAIKR